jgi:glucosyl-dolichyl phosphate glucuronosyltransferase
MNIVLSIIICTYNRAGLLGKCLDSILKQETPPESFEAIIIDNNSTDNTKEIVSQYTNKLPHLKYVFEENQGLSYARNRGFKEAAAEYLIYLDDDAIAPPQYLTIVAGIIKEHTPDIMGGPVYPYYTTPKPRWFKDEYEIKKYEPVSGFSLTCGITGANYVIRKRIVENLGGFDVNLGMIGDKVWLGEERKMLEQYRSVTPPGEQKVYYALECFITHHVPPEKMTLRYIMKRAYIAGRTLILVKNRGPEFAFSAVIILVKEVFSEIKHGFKADIIQIARVIIIRTANILEVIKQYGIITVFRSFFSLLKRRWFR